MNKLYIIFIFIFLSCKKSTEKKNDFPIQSEHHFKENTFTISNNNAISTSFTFKINEKFPIDTKMIIDSVYNIAESLKIDTAEAAWHYVVKNSFHTTPFSESQWLHNEYIFANSVNSGYCDDVATFLVKIWQNLGYQARVVGLDGHVVAEVFHNNKWKIYDPDLRMYFKNKFNEVASLNEIETDSFSLNHPSSFYPSIFTFNELSNQKFKNYYLTKINNTDISEWSLANQEIDSFFRLPPRSKFTIYKDSLQNMSFAVISFTEKNKGILNIPLVPFCVEGNIEYRLKDSVVNLNAKNLTSFIESYNQIEVLNTSKNAKIYYLISTNLELFDKENILRLSAEKKLSISNVKVKKYSCNSNLASWKFDSQIDELYENKLQIYFQKISEEGYKFQNLESEFKLYSSLVQVDKNYQDVLKYKLDIMSKFQISEDTFMLLIKESYPKSVILFFTSLIENNKEPFFLKLEENLEKRT